KSAAISHISFGSLVICPEGVIKACREDDDGLRKRLHLDQKEIAAGDEVLRSWRDVEN
ncbi:unnamed protein product, partial [Rotaria sp. Silwood2]